MKIKIFFLIFIFMVMGIIPVMSMGNTSVNQQDKTRIVENSDKNKKNDKNQKSENSILEGLLYAKYNEELNDETLKAFAVLFNNNLKKNEKAFDLTDKNIYISDLELKEKFSDNYTSIIEKIKKVINDTNNIYIYLNNEITYVPFSECSSGATYTDEKYKNLISVASPWDKISEKYNKDIKCVGVSLNGIKFLTNYFDYKTALMWYLPKYEIK